MDEIQLTKEINDLKTKMEILKKDYEYAVSNIKTQLKDRKICYNILTNDMNLDKIKLAETILDVSGEYRTSSQRVKCVEDMIYFFAEEKSRVSGDPREGYYGVKNYSSFGDQREDHSYGRAPSYGNIVFSVGIKREVRNKIFDIDERNACIYYLENIQKIQNIKKEAI